MDVVYCVRDIYDLNKFYEMKFYEKHDLETSSRTILIKERIWGGLHANLDKF